MSSRPLNRYKNGTASTGCTPETGEMHILLFAGKGEAGWDTEDGNKVTLINKPSGP